MLHLICCQGTESHANLTELKSVLVNDEAVDLLLSFCMEVSAGCLRAFWLRHPRTHTCAQTHTKHTYKRINIHTNYVHTHAHMHTCTHAHSHAYSHAYIYHIYTHFYP